MFNALKSEGYDNFESQDAFNQYISDPGNRNKLYNALKSEGYDNFENENDFDSYLGISVSMPANQSSSAPKAGAVAQEVVDEYDAIKRANAQNRIQGNEEQSVPSPYVGKDDSGRITVFGVPYDEYQNMPKEEQSKVYRKAIKDRKDQQLKGFGAHADDLKASVNSELKEVMDLHNAEDKSYAKEHPVLSFLQGFGQAQTGGRNQRTIEANPRYRNLMAAASLIKDSENRLAEASADKSSSISNFGRGVRDKAFDVDTWTAGFSELADNTALIVCS